MPTPNKYGHYHTSTPAAALDPGYRARVARRAGGSTSSTPATPAGPLGASDQGFYYRPAAGGFPGATLAGPGGISYALETSSLAPGDDADPLHSGNNFGDNFFDPYAANAPAGGNGGAFQGSGDTSGSFGTPTPATTVAGGAPPAPWHFRRALKGYAAAALALLSPASSSTAGAIGADPATTGIRYRAKRPLPGWKGWSTNTRILAIAAAGVGVFLTLKYRGQLIKGS